jgi:hypothetical protein
MSISISAFFVSSKTRREIDRRWAGEGRQRDTHATPTVAEIGVAYTHVLVKRRRSFKVKFSSSVYETRGGGRGREVLEVMRVGSQLQGRVYAVVYLFPRLVSVVCAIPRDS